MVRNGTRRCDLCASEILGRSGVDICVICRVALEDDVDHQVTETLAEVEGFGLTAVVGRSYVGLDRVVAANDERPAKRAPHHVRRRVRAPKFTVPQGMVRLAAGLRSISRRRLG